MTANDVAQDIEQLRDIFYARFTYDNDVEWVDNLETALYELCQKSGQNTVEQECKLTN